MPLLRPLVSVPMQHAHGAICLASHPPSPFAPLNPLSLDQPAHLPHTLHTTSPQTNTRWQPTHRPTLLPYRPLTSPPHLLAHSLPSSSAPLAAPSLHPPPPPPLPLAPRPRPPWQACRLASCLFRTRTRATAWCWWRCCCARCCVARGSKSPRLHGGCACMGVCLHGGMLAWMCACMEKLPLTPLSRSLIWVSPSPPFPLPSWPPLLSPPSAGCCRPPVRCCAGV